MQKFLSITLLLLFPALLHAQRNVTKFLGIPVDGSKWTMAQKLKEKGFVYNSEKNRLEGEFNGENSYVGIKTNKNKVRRIYVGDKTTRSEEQIKRKYNQLLDAAINADDSYKVGDTSIRDYANEFLDKRNAVKDVAAMINQEGNAPLVHRQYISDHVDVPGWLADVDDDNIERIGEKHQSTANKIKNGFVQAAGGFTAGFIQSFTSMADAWNHTTGNYKYNPDSIVDNAMEDMNNYLQREYRIFGANHRGFNASYISNIIAQSGTTFGMVGANALIEAVVGLSGSLVVLVLHCRL